MSPSPPPTHTHSSSNSFFFCKQHNPTSATLFCSYLVDQVRSSRAVFMQAPSPLVMGPTSLSNIGWAFLELSGLYPFKAPCTATAAARGALALLSSPCPANRLTIHRFMATELHHHDTPLCGNRVASSRYTAYWQQSCIITIHRFMATELHHHDTPLIGTELHHHDTPLIGNRAASSRYTAYWQQSCIITIHRLLATELHHRDTPLIGNRVASSRYTAYWQQSCIIGY